MNVLMNFVIIYLFIMIVISLKLPFIKTDNIIINKMYLFIGIFLLQVVVLTINKINKKCKTSQLDIFKEASKIALLSVIGYSLYIDMIQSNKISENWIDNPRKNMLLICFVISGFTTLYKIFDNSLLPSECNE